MERYEPCSTVFDVVVATNNLYWQNKKPNPTLKPFPDTIISLTDNIIIGRLSQDLCRKIMCACDPAYYPKQPTFQYTQIYCFVKELRNVTPDGELNNIHWDKELEECVALSRLVRPNPVSLKYAARVFMNGDRSVKRIIAGPVSGPGAHAFVAETNKQFWLDQSDLRKLQKLWCAWISSTLPERVRNAFWIHEYISRTHELNIRWALVITAIEALINTDSKHATSQFVKRTPMLATLIGQAKLSNSKADKAYQLRSQFVHAGSIDEFSTAARNNVKMKHLLDLYLQIEGILRAVIKSCIVVPEMAKIFSNKESIDQKFKI